MLGALPSMITNRFFPIATRMMMLLLSLPGRSHAQLGSMPSFSGPTVGGGLGSGPISLGGPPTQPASPLLSAGLLGQQQAQTGMGAQAPGMGGAAPGQLPTLNLLGGATPGGMTGGSPVEQLQAQALREKNLDILCAGKTRQTRDVGAECWAKIWVDGGCKAENVPEYESWHQAQSLEILVADVVQWANLPDERHKQGCLGNAGPPKNEPPPPAAPGGMGLGGGMGGLGGGMGGLGGLAAGGGMGGMAGNAPQGPPPPPEVLQKVQASLDSPDLPGLCPGLDRQATGIGEGCWRKIWTHVGCLEESTPPYEQWHNTQSLEVLVADAAQWASLPSDRHKKTCYGSRAEL